MIPPCLHGRSHPQVSRYSDPVRWSPDVEPQARMFHSPDIYGYLAVDGTLSHHFNADINTSLNA